jgi:glutamyl-tRNA reductase
MERALRLLAKGDDPRQVLDALSHGLANKLLHGPTRYLNQSEGEQQADASRIVQQLFNLNSHD